MIMQTSRFTPRNILYFLFALLGTLGSAGLAVLFLSMAIVSRFMGPIPGQDSTTWAGLSFGFIAVCGLPALYLAIRAFFKPHEVILPRVPRAAFLVLLLLPIPAGLAYLAYELDWLPMLLGPIGHILAASIPVLIVAIVVMRSGPRIGVRKASGQFLAGLWAMPPVILILEILALLPTGLILLLFVSMSESGSRILDLLSAPDTSPQGLETLIEGILFEPWAILIAVIYIAVLVPLIEETIKTMAIWPWLRNLTPAQAFMGGALGGAGYGLFEAFLLVQPGQDWLLAMVGRAGATVLHAFTAGISCWGIAQWTANKRPLHTLLGYTMAVVLHGMWNASAIFMGLATYASSMGETGRMLGNADLIASIGAGVIICLSLLTMVGLPWMGHRLNQSNLPLNPETEAWEQRNTDSIDPDDPS